MNDVLGSDLTVSASKHPNAADRVVVIREYFGEHSSGVTEGPDVEQLTLVDVQTARRLAEALLRVARQIEEARGE